MNVTAFKQLIESVEKRPEERFDMSHWVKWGPCGTRLALAAFDLIERNIVGTRTALSDALEIYADDRFGVFDGSGIRRLREAVGPEALAASIGRHG